MSEDLSSGVIWIGSYFAVPESELEFIFTRSSAPGGQHVNKTSSSVQLRFDVHASSSLPSAVKARLLSLAGGRVTSTGVLLIDSQEHRSQQRNRAEAVRRFQQLLLAAARPVKKRHPTRPTLASRERRLQSKRRLSERKQRRRYQGGDD